MRLSIFLFRCISLLTIPGMTLPPPSDPITCTIAEIPTNYRFMHYDDILNLLTLIEQKDLEHELTPNQIEQITNFMCTLALNGTSPNNPIRTAEITEDIYALQFETRNDYRYSFCFNHDNLYSILPAVHQGNATGTLCKSWMSKQCRGLKKFVKKHKTAIIIGAVIIVAATATIIVIAAVSTKAATAAAVAAAGSATSGLASNESDQPNLNSTPKSYQAQTTETESIDYHQNTEEILPSTATPSLAQVIEEKTASVKTILIEEAHLDVPPLDNHSNHGFFVEKARELGSYMAHEILNAAAEIGSFVPELQSELTDIGAKIFPSSLHASEDSNLIHGNPVKCYNDTIQNFHEKIDQVFDTNQAEYYTTEAKNNDPINDWAIGMLPPPGFCNIPTNKLLEAGKAIDRAGFSKAGRALMKHGYRDPSVFPKPTGNPLQINEYGQNMLAKILNHQDKKIVHRNVKYIGEVIDIQSPIGGARFSISGEMIGFLEP